MLFTQVSRNCIWSLQFEIWIVGNGPRRLQLINLPANCNAIQIIYIVFALRCVPCETYMVRFIYFLSDWSAVTLILKGGAHRNLDRHLRRWCCRPVEGAASLLVPIFKFVQSESNMEPYKLQPALPRSK
jgi:hypothetical protein